MWVSFSQKNLLPIKDICNLLKWSWKRFVGTKQFITIHLFYEENFAFICAFLIGKYCRGNPIGVEKARQIALEYIKNNGAYAPSKYAQVEKVIKEKCHFLPMLTTYLM